MTTSTETTSTAVRTDIDTVRAVFGTFASGDLATLGDLLHADATWNHHSPVYWVIWIDVAAGGQDGIC